MRSKLISGAWTNIQTRKRSKGDLPRSWAWRKVRPGKVVRLDPSQFNKPEVTNA